MSGVTRIDCPVCTRKRGDQTCVVWPSGRVHCHRCAAELGDDHWKLVKAALASAEVDWKPPERAEVHEQHQVLSDYGWMLWNECRPLEGVAVAYLEARCCSIPPRDGDLRWHPELRARWQKPKGVWHEYVGPALVGLMTDFATGAARTLHRTWITPSGDKAGPGRLNFFGHQKKGAVIRLWPDEAVTDRLFVAEGIESGLSAAARYAPMWATADAGNMGGLPVLRGVECLTVFADNDRAGLNAARRLAARWHAAGRDVTVKVPRFGNDANDVAQHLAREAAAHA